MDGSGDASARADVVVLDEDGVIEAGAVVVAAADAHGVLLEDAMAGCGLAGVEDDCVCTLDGLSGTAAHSGYTREALEEVESGALAGENNVGRAGDACYFAPLSPGAF